jgi:hypothetical protein
MRGSRPTCIVISMVRWVQHYGTTSTSSGGANDDVGANDPSQVDDGDGDDAMDE